VAVPIAAGAAAASRRGRLPELFAGVLALGAVLILMLVGVFGALFGLQPAQVGYGPSATARAEIPRDYLALYLKAGAEYGVDPWILAGIGAIESNHGRSAAVGVRSGLNAFGCCAGPMQFNVTGAPSTWDAYGVDGNADGRMSPYEPADAIPAAARYLSAAGAPADNRAALFAYNHADWYVAEVLAKAAEFRGAVQGSPLPQLSAAVGTVLRDPRIALTLLQRADLRDGLVDPRLVSALATIAARHSIVVTSLRSDHSTYTVDGNVSNHSAGRAMDIGAVDGEVCRGARSGPCAELVRALAGLDGPLRATELIYCWDPDGAADPRGFARADHCDHIHWGLDG
jgi:Transglycosylase SLT domain